LGALYEKKKEYKKAAEYFLISAKFGHPSAMNNLGFMYKGGRHPDGPNHKKAIELYLQAAKLGVKEAMYNLGCLYEEKDGMREDVIFWFTKASELGNEQSKIKLKKYMNKPLPRVYTHLNTEICGFCFDTLINTNSRITVLLCGHALHENCLLESKWPECPICRHVI